MILNKRNRERTGVFLFLAAVARLSWRSLRMAANEYSVEDICWSVGIGLVRDQVMNSVTQSVTYFEAERNGMNPQALLIAPNPDKTPRTIVPRIISRDSALVKTSWDVKPAGSGIWARVNRNTTTGIKLINMRMPKNRPRPCS